MTNPWFKFFGGEYLADQKIKSLTPQERSCWVTLLCMSANSSTPGIIEYLTIEVLLESSGIKFDPYHPEEWDKCLAVLVKFERMKMIVLQESGTIEIINWNKRQSSPLSVTERVRKYRLKSKINDTNVTFVTNCNENDNGRIEENRREEDINTSAPVGASITKIPKKAKRIKKLDDNDPYTLEEFCSKMKESPQAHIRWIAEYADEKKPSFTTKGQWREFLNRNLAPAVKIRKYTDEQIEKAFEMIQWDLKSNKKNPKGYITKWGIETILKYLDEVQ